MWGECEAEYERRAYRVVELISLPDTGLAEADLDGWHGRGVDWQAVSQAAVDALTSGLDPVDREAVESATQWKKLATRDREWAKQLLTQPICLYAVSRRWVDGRHRVEAMRVASVRRCVVQLLA